MQGLTMKISSDYENVEYEYSSITLKLFYAPVFKVGSFSICVLRSFPSWILKKHFSISANYDEQIRNRQLIMWN